jgi:cytochrome c-type biogenesis protein
MGAVVLSFAAGTLSILSPCVLPLLPIVVAGALQEHRHGPLALASGLVLSSAAIGLFFASLGFTAGVDRDTARAAAAAFMAAAGVTLLVPRLQAVVATVASPLANAAGGLTRRLPAGLGGQLLSGLLLGAVWTPCTGPTLAAAVTLAAQSDTLPRAAVVMLFFGVGAVVPVLALAYGWRATFGHRGRYTALAATGKTLMGALLLMVGVLTVTGADKVIEAWMVERMPGWLLDLTTWL